MSDEERLRELDCSPSKSDGSGRSYPGINIWKGRWRRWSQTYWYLLRARVNGHKLRRRKLILFKHKKKLFRFQAVEKIAQRCGIAVCEVIQTTSGHGPEQPVPAVASWSRGLGLHDLLGCLPTLTFLWFCKIEILFPCYTETQALLNLQSQEAFFWVPKYHQIAWLCPSLTWGWNSYSHHSCLAACLVKLGRESCWEPQQLSWAVWLRPSPESLQAGLHAAWKTDGSIQNSHDSTDDKFGVLLHPVRLEMTSQWDYVFSMIARSWQARDLKERGYP